MQKKTWGLGIVWSLTLLMGGCTYDPACTPRATDCAIITKIDLTPQDGTYNINWTGNKNNYSLVEHYAIHLKLDRNAPEKIILPVGIQEKRWNGWRELGYFIATFAKGAQTPTIEYKRQCCGASTYPDGTPEVLTDGTFWIGCTQKAKIKANGPKGDDSNATIRLETNEFSYGVKLSQKVSPKHEVNCK